MNLCSSLLLSLALALALTIALCLCLCVMGGMIVIVELLCFHSLKSKYWVNEQR